MKLPWDKQYLKISFHVIFTILLIYILGLLIRNIHLAKKVILQFGSQFIAIFAPLIVAIVFSFLMNPAVKFFENLWQKYVPLEKNERLHSRKRGTISLYLCLLGLFVGLISFLVIKIGSTDITSLANQINKHIQDFTDLFVLLGVKLMEFGVFQNFEKILSGWTTNFSNLVQTTVLGIATSFTKAGGWIINLVLGLTIGFYLLVEKEKIIHMSKEVVTVFFHDKTAQRIKKVSHEIVNVFSGYIGGQVTDALIMAVLISVSFTIAGIPYAVLIGVISGFSNLIPYVGAIMAFILSVTVGLLSGTPIKALYAVIIVLILQQIDSIFIVPRVVGKSVELHPALVLLSLAIFGGMFGIFGMIVAVPCGALLKTFAIWFYHRQKEKRNPS